jgi:hypothetical protein
MKSKICFLAAVAVLIAAAVATASPRALYRIELRDGSEVLSNDRPYQRGSVILFHRHSNGVLTSLPEEEVVDVVANVIDVKTQGLQPGDVVFLPPTGAGAPSTTAPATAAAPAAIPGGVYDPRNPAYGYSGPRYGTNPLAVSNGVFSPATSAPPVAPGDLARAVSASPPTAENPIGPNGFPTTPGGSAPDVGPDGLPILAPPGSAGATPLTIGPNGTPVMAPAGAPGSSAPVIGPNGTPVLAPAGTPGSTSPAVGPNGYPSSPGPGR